MTTRFSTLVLALLLLPLQLLGAPATTGSISGRVANSETHQFLTGAVVSLQGQSRETTTDESGHYSFEDLRPGTYTVMVSYLGLDPATKPAVVEAGRLAAADFALTTSVYQLQGLTVTGMREGSAEAITSQRTAPNLVSVQALDALGNLPNDNAGEMLIRMPGVAASLDAENNVQGVIIRGAAPGLNTVSIDGNLVPGPGGVGRNFQTHSVSGALFDEIEVVKAPTPDMPSDSLGGAVIMKTRDPLSMQDNSEVAYRVADRWAAPFFDQTPMRKQHAMQPLLSAAAQEVFSVFGGDRNLGISLNVFYSENASGYHESALDNQYTLSSPAYNYEYQQIDGYNNRKQTSGDLKIQYKFDEHTTVSFNVLYNDAFEPYNPIYTMTASTGRTLATLGSNGQPTATNTGGILPGYTDNTTTVLPVASSQVQLNSTQYSFIDRQRLYDLRAKQDYGNLHLDYDGDYNYAHANLGNGRSQGNQSGGIFTMMASNVGWGFDRSQSSLYPTFLQNAGPNIYSPSSYTTGLMVTRNDKRYTEVYGTRANARYDLPDFLSSSIKAGVSYLNEKWLNAADNSQYSYLGSPGNLADPAILTYDERRTGLMFPFVQPTYVAQQIVTNPSQWTPNAYYHRMQYYTGTNKVDEAISAAYVQYKARIGHLDILTGVRGERTEDAGHGFVQAKVLSTAAQQAANPIGSADADYNHPETIKGSYTNYFPGVYLIYHLNKSLLWRGDFSESIGRPTAADLEPAQTANNTTQTLTIANPSLKPQFAKNFDTDLEYYFEPVGVLSAGWFRKDIRDFIVSSNIGTIGLGADNGYNGDYGGYTVISNTNGGTAIVQGWEFGYQQQFTFLPGFLKGFGIFANYTQLQTNGNYGGTGVVGTNAVAGFVPKTANAGVSYSYGRFGARILANYTGRYLQTASTSVGRNLYRYARTIANVGFTYRISRAANVSVDFTNLFNEAQTEYWGAPRYFAAEIIDGTQVTIGLSGKF